MVRCRGAPLAKMPAVTTLEKIELAGVVVTALIGALGWWMWWRGRLGERRPIRLRSRREFARWLPDDRGGMFTSPDDVSMLRIAPVFITNRSQLRQEVTISERSSVLWPRFGRQPELLRRSVELDAGQAGNLRLMLRSRQWPNADGRRYLLLLRCETARGDRVRLALWTRLSGYMWGEPPGVAG